MITKEMISESVKDITDYAGPPYTEDFLYRLMYFDQYICGVVLWSCGAKFFKINLINHVVLSKAILNNKHYIELSDHPLEELKSALFKREREKERKEQKERKEYLDKIVYKNKPKIED